MAEEACLHDLWRPLDEKVQNSSHYHQHGFDINID
jgi:hypothetical protein